MNSNILGINELKCTGLDKFNSDDHYIYYCGQESLRRNGVSSGVNKRVQKKICFCFIDYAKAFHYVDHNKLWKILKEMGIADHLTCLLRNLYGRSGSNS